MMQEMWKGLLINITFNSPDIAKVQSSAHYNYGTGTRWKGDREGENRDLE